MEKKKILVVDDEKNIRLTLARALDSPKLSVLTAGDGEEALQRLTETDFSLVLLDLKLPGIDGLEVLHRIRTRSPELPVIMITAHGSIESAVAAMKAGAVDFLRKPFSLDEVRSLVDQVLARRDLERENPVGYPDLIAGVQKAIREGGFEDAGETARRAVARDPGRPEAYNLLGALQELKHKRLEAQKYYRAALEIDPTYGPALANLERITLRRQLGPIDTGEGRE